MKITEEPDRPYKLATTLSGRRVHLTVPVGYHELTLCREVVYKRVTAAEVQGRELCQSCVDRRPE